MEVAGTESGMAKVEGVEVGNESLDAAMVVVLQKMPVQATVVVPFGGLSEVASHKEGFFARPSPHPTVEGAKLSGFFSNGGGAHFEKHGAFAVDDFIVGECQIEAFGMLVNGAEGKPALVPFSMNGVFFEIL